MAGQHDVTAEWAAEEIPDMDDLFMAVHWRAFKTNGTVAPAAFRNHGEGMSTDWSKYSSPYETRQRRKKPADNAVVVMNVGTVRAIPGQRVVHSPLLINRAHTDVQGEKSKDPEVRVKLRRAAEIIIPLEEDGAR